MKKPPDQLLKDFKKWLSRPSIKLTEEQETIAEELIKYLEEQNDPTRTEASGN